MRQATLSLVLAAVLLPGALAPSAAAAGPDRPDLVPDEIVVKFAPGVTEQARGRLRALYNLAKKRDSYKKGAFTVYTTPNPHAVANLLKHEQGVVYAEQNAYAYATAFVPNDTYYGYQWDMRRIGMEQAWTVSQGAGVVVAVVDTGVRQSLEDLAETNFTAGYDFVNGDTDPTDDEGHGSHVCGTIAQSTNNGIGVAGIAYEATIMPVKVLDKTGSGSYTDIADGIDWAADHGAAVINMSLGGSTDLAVLHDACDYAWNKGVVIVVAAGNAASSAPQYPAAYPVCISVTATDSLDRLASYSSYGETVDIAAPGGDSNDSNGDGYSDMILQNTFVRRTEGYYFFAGTSMAAPHVSGVAALVKAVNPSLSNSQIRAILEDNAEDLGTSGWDQYYGNGLVDAAAPVAAAGGAPANQPPVADFTWSAADLAVTFTDASTDSDGTVSAWQWSFGDGSGSSLANPTHTYAAAGSYTVTLTVTDDGGASSATSKTVSVTAPGGGGAMHVAAISMTSGRAGKNLYADATIAMADDAGAPVANATVTVTFSGSVSGTASGVTGADGTVTLRSPKTKTAGTITVTVTGATHATLTYDPGANTVSSASITVP